MASSLISTDLRAHATEEVGIPMAAWALETAHLLGLSVLAGRHYFLDSYILVIPRGYFLTCGVPAILGMAYSPRRVPFLNYRLIFDFAMDPLVVKAIHESGKLPGSSSGASVVRYCIAARNQVANLFGQTQYPANPHGLKVVTRCLQNKTIKPFDQYLNM